MPALVEALHGVSGGDASVRWTRGTSESETRDARRERKRDAGSPNKIGPTSNAYLPQQTRVVGKRRCCCQVNVTCKDDRLAEHYYMYI